MKYSKEEIFDVFWNALEDFNECMESDIGKENTIVEFFNYSNGFDIYREICNTYFPEWYDAICETEGYFETVAAMALVGKNKYGVLIWEDMDFSLTEIYRIFMHEISHLFCTKHEIEGEIFYDKFCVGEDIEDGVIYAGYAIWREAIADIMAANVISDYAEFTLRQVKNDIMRLYNYLSDKSNAKKAMSQIIAYIMLSDEVAGTESWDVAKQEIDNIIKFEIPIVMSILECVFDNLHTGLYWTIDKDFIINLGGLYELLLGTKAVKENLAADKRIKPNLDDVIEAIEMLNAESSAFYNLSTGNFEWISEYMDRREYEEAIDRVENGNYISFLSQWDINEYQMIEEFVHNCTDGYIQRKLENAISGKGAFRRFKNEINYFGIENSWYEYRDEKYRRLAVKWCEDNNLL